MSTRVWLVVAVGALLLGGTRMANAATPEEVVREYFDTLQHDMVAAADFMHPAEMQRFKEMLVPVYREEAADGESEFLTATFGATATLKQLEDTTALEFCRSFLRFIDAGMKDMRPSFDRIEVLGSVGEGEVQHILTRFTIGVGPMSMTKLEVVSVKPFEGTWKVMLNGQMEGMAQAIRAGRERRRQAAP